MLTNLPIGSWLRQPARLAGLGLLLSLSGLLACTGPQRPPQAPRNAACTPPPTAARFADLCYPMPTATLRADGVEIAYSDTGTGEPALLLIHGLGSYLPSWQRNLPALSQRHRVVAIDLPGYGRSDKGDHPYSMAFFAAILDRVIAERGLGKLVLVGHSMGGQIALTYALSHPGRAQALVLLAPAGLETFTDDEARRLAGIVTPEAVAATPPAMIQRNAAKNFFNPTPEVAFLGDDRVRILGGPDLLGYARAVSRSVRGMLEEPVLSRLSEITVPVLLIFGEEDALIPNAFFHGAMKTRGIAEAGARRLPQATLKMIPQAGHMVHVERPAEVNAAMLEFLR